MIDKELIKNRFNSKLDSYDTSSIVQKEVADKLVQTLLDFGLTDFDTILEIGAGTGHLSEIMEQKLAFSKLILNDIAPLSKAYLSQKLNTSFSFIEGDAETMVLPSGINAVFSSSVIQWFENLDVFFDKIHTSLSNKGLIAISTFGVDNFKEIKEITGLGLEYKPTNELKDIISKNYNIIYAKDWNIEMEFESAFEVFNHIKKTGVNAIKKEIKQSSSMKRYLQEYEDKFESNGKVILTYNPVIIIAQKS